MTCLENMYLMVSGVAVVQVSAQIDVSGTRANAPANLNVFVEGTLLRIDCDAEPSSSRVSWERVNSALPSEAYIADDTALV